MTALALRVDNNSEDLFDGYRVWVATLPIQPSVRHDRIWRAGRFLAAHPDPAVWMGRPTRARLADLHRVKAWPFATWLFVTGRIRPDLELVAAKPCGVDLPAVWAAAVGVRAHMSLEVRAHMSLAQRVNHGTCTGVWPALPAGVSQVCSSSRART